MPVNTLPKINMADNETGCCPKFNPKPWNKKKFVFKNKLFAKASTINFMHMPLNMGRVIQSAWKKITDAKAGSDEFVILSCDPSPWKGDHYFSVTKDVPGLKMEKLSGTFLTKVFEGPFKDAKKWVDQSYEYAKSKGARGIQLSGIC